MKLFQREELNHTPHILASVFLCGLWLPFWILTTLTFNPPWRCSFCGYGGTERNLRDPSVADELRKHLIENERITREKNAAYREALAGSHTVPEKLITWVSYHKSETVGLTGLIVLFLVVFPLIVVVGVGSGHVRLANAKPTPATSKTPNAPLTEADKKYLSAAVSYSTGSLRRNRTLAETAVKVGEGKTSLRTMRKLIAKARSDAQRSWKSEYLPVSATSRFKHEDVNMKRIHSNYIAAYDELLKYWDDGRVDHIPAGTDELQKALKQNQQLTQRLTIELSSIK